MNRTTALSTVPKNGGVPAKRWEKTVTPSADILETPEAFVVLLDLPGAQKESISVSIENNMLSVSAPVQRTHKENEVSLLSELDSTRYHRSFVLGGGVDTGRVDAWFENGVLMLKLSKREEIKPKEIPIR